MKRNLNFFFFHSRKLLSRPIIDTRRPILRDNLLEHHDYEAVSKQIFRRLKNWYGCDFEIVRFIKKNEFLGELDVDLYPGFFKKEQIFQKIKANSILTIN